MAFVFPIETARQYLFVILSVLFTAMAVVAVGLRLLARRVADRKLGWDDALMTLSCIVLVAYLVASILGSCYFESTCGWTRPLIRPDCSDYVCLQP